MTPRRFSGLLTAATLAVAASVDGVMRQERASHGRHNTIEVDGKALMKRESPLEQRGTLPPTLAPKPALLNAPKELVLAYLSDAVYRFEASVAEWDLKGQISRVTYGHDPVDMPPGTNRMTRAALYSKTTGNGNYTPFNTQCAIVFAVDADWEHVQHWTEHNESKSTTNLEQCKLEQVHKGMLEEWLSLALTKVWKTDFQDYAESKCDEMFTGGHAFGGALASIFAACSNGAYGEATLPHMFRDGIVVEQGAHRKFMNVSGLYTFGAPAVSKTQLTNHFAEDGSFAGGRFYNEDYIYFDPLPMSGTSLGLLHPKVAAIRLKDQDSGWIARKEYQATSLEARRQPNYFRTPLAHEQDVATYLERAARAPVKTDLTEPGLIGKSTTAPPSLKRQNLTSPDHGEFHAKLGDAAPGSGAFAVPKFEAGARRGSQSLGLLVACTVWATHLLGVTPEI